MNKKIIVGTLLGCIFGATVGYSASVVSLPNTFTAGTAIKASEVNANFSALAQEIMSVKSSVGLNQKSSDFAEMTVTPVSTTVGSTITVGSNSYLIKQKTGIEDPITGKSYTLNYPKLIRTGTSDIGITTNNCKVMTNGLVLRSNSGNSFKSYIALSGRLYDNDIGGMYAVFVYTNIQVSDNLCVSLMTDGTEKVMTHARISPMIDSATELQKYISVQEV